MSPLLSATPVYQLEAFNALESPRDVADLLEIEYSLLVYHVYKVTDDQKYLNFQIPKKSGGKREIWAPTTSLKFIQQKLNEVLLNVYRPKPSVYSYVKGKNIVKNANNHKGKRFVFNIDLEDFFPSINFGRVRGLFISRPYNLPENVATLLAQICCLNNQLPQGAPTSPIISNMICSRMDSQLQHLAGRNKCYYTRYADDITFSTSVPNFPCSIAKIRSLTEVEVGEDLEQIISTNGFRINRKKIRMQIRYRREQVTGLTVNEFPNVRRNYVRRIRGMLHAWEHFGLTNAEADFFLYHDEKYRNPELELPSFKQILKGKIEFLGMVRGRQNTIYLRFLRKYNFLDKRDKEVPSLRLSNLDEISRPHIYTEGKTDRAILIAAWNCLYDHAMIEFVIRDSDPFPKGSDQGGAGGAIAIKTLLNAQRYDSHHIVVGIFDRDKEGIKEYNSLHSDYAFDPENDWKISINRKAGAFLLPVPPGKESYSDFENLCIEFCFSEEVLARRTSEDYGLNFSYPPVTIEGRKIDTELRIPETRKIQNDGGKKVFAESIVPTLERSEFENFRLVFEKIIGLCNEIDNA